MVKLRVLRVTFLIIRPYMGSSKNGTSCWGLHYAPILYCTIIGGCCKEPLNSIHPVDLPVSWFDERSSVIMLVNSARKSGIAPVIHCTGNTHWAWRSNNHQTFTKELQDNMETSAHFPRKPQVLSDRFSTNKERPLPSGAEILHVWNIGKHPKYQIQINILGISGDQRART